MRTYIKSGTPDFQGVALITVRSEGLGFVGQDGERAE